jgi:hypothetical protein
MAALTETRDVSDWARHVAKTGSDLGEEMQLTTRSTSDGRRQSRPAYASVEFGSRYGLARPGKGRKTFVQWFH